MKRNIQIDALRAIAALLVLVTHASESFLQAAQAHEKSLWLYKVSHALDFGRVGVVVFFIISGYVVANALGDSGVKIKDFAVRRFFRLFPLYWVSLIGAYFVFFGGSVDAKQLLSNIVMIPIHLGEEPLMGLYWTLETELIFYLLAVTLFWLGLLRRYLSLLLCVFGLIALFAGFMFGVVAAPINLSLKSLPLNLCFMLMGVLVHVLHSRKANDVDKRYQAYALAAVVLVSLTPSMYSLLNYFSTYSADSLRWALSYPIAVASFFLLMAMKGRIIQHLAGLGAVSYSIYLLHPFAFAFVVELVGDHLLVKSTGLTGAVLVAALVTILISFVSYQLVELPFISFAKRITTAVRK